MSLTSFLNNKEVKAKFRKEFTNPRHNLKEEVKVPPRTRNYGIVGTAFDYLLRFYLEHKYLQVFQRDHWAAEEAVPLLQKSHEVNLETQYNAIAINGFDNLKAYLKNQNKPYSIKKTKYSRILVTNDISFAEPINRDHLQEFARSKLNQAKRSYQAFLKSGFLSSHLLDSLIILAQLEVTTRSGKIDPYLGKVDGKDKTDLKRLFNLINDDVFSFQEKAFINPDFGKASRAIGGADADLILDDTLIDIKTSKNLVVEQDYLNQLIGYYLLSLIGGVNGDPNEKPIKNLGIYFSRHGILWKMPVYQLGPSNKVERFKQWFQNAIEKVS